MILLFEKNENEEIQVKINGGEFSSKDYIDIIKAVKGGVNIEARFSDDILEEDKESVNQMISRINQITSDKIEKVAEAPLKESSEDLPF